MSESKNKKKKQKKTIDLHTFQSMGGPASSLSSGPGVNLPSGPGAPGGRSGYGNDRRGGRRGGYQQEASRADESHQWRRGSGAPRQQRSSTSFGGDRSFGRDRDRGGFGSRDRGDRDGPRMNRDRGDRPSRYGDDGGFDRSKFGSAPKRTGISAGRSFGGFDRDSRRTPPDRDDPATPTRDAFGTKKPIAHAPVRSYPARTYNRQGPRYQSPPEDHYGPTERGPFDGSGEGFGAELVADCFVEKDSSGMGRTNLISDRPAPVGASRFSRAAEEPVARSRANPWGATKAAQPGNEKTPEEIAEEKERQEEEDAKRRKAAEERAEKKRLAAEKKEKAKREVAQKARLAKEEVDRIKGLHDFVQSMFEDKTPRELTVEHIEVVFPSLADCTAEQATIIGQALAMTVLKEVVTLNAAVQAIPQEQFDVVFINFLTCMCKRQGELKFVQALQEAQIDVFETITDMTGIEEKLKAAGLDCLVPKNEVQEILENAFNKHQNLDELYQTLQALDGGLPNELFQRVSMYMFDEFFTAKSDPEEYFTSAKVFDFLCPESGGMDLLLEMLSSCLTSWYNNGHEESVLYPVLDCLLKNQSTFPEVVSEWYNNADYNDVKQAVLYMEDFWEGNNFMSWVDQLEDLYEDEEESEDPEVDEYGFETTTMV